MYVYIYIYIYIYTYVVLFVVVAFVSIDMTIRCPFRSECRCFVRGVGAAADYDSNYDYAQCPGSRLGW